MGSHVRAEVVNLTAVLDGRDEVLPDHSIEPGKAEANVETSGDVLTYTATYSGPGPALGGGQFAHGAIAGG